jgi:ABC-type amino acid transport system permease subunit
VKKSVGKFLEAGARYFRWTSWFTVAACLVGLFLGAVLKVASGDPTPLLAAIGAALAAWILSTIAKRLGAK